MSHSEIILEDQIGQDWYGMRGNSELIKKLYGLVWRIHAVDKTMVTLVRRNIANVRSYKKLSREQFLKDYRPVGYIKEATHRL